MIYYASRTGTRRNLAAMRDAGFRLLVSRTGVWRTEGFCYALDNGAWTDFQSGSTFDEDRFEKLLSALGAGADWTVLPDIVAGGLKSLELSIRWMNRVLATCARVLIAVQDGMEPSDLAPLVGRNVGVFLGGSTAWKLNRMSSWGAFCAERGVYYHVARTNSQRRIWMAAAAGADSVDGSNPSRFAVNVPMLAAALKQHDLFNPRKAA